MAVKKEAVKKEAAKIDVGSGAFQAAESAASSTVASLFDKLADRIGANAGASAVFGEPIEKDGRTVDPVAQAMWGGGVGTGESEDEDPGSGGGGGGMSKPLGYIEITEHMAQFVPLKQPWQSGGLILAYAVAIWLVSRAINRILRG